MLKEIWCEGDPQHDFTATHLGYGKGETLKQACEDLASRRQYFRKVWNPDRMTYWGCKIHDNPIDASASYG